MKHDESRVQQAVIEWFGYAHRGLGVPHPSLLWHIPNGGRRDKITASRLKKEGVRAGVPDLFLAVPNIPRGGRHSGLFIEMKSLIGRPSPEQVELISHLRGQGYDCQFARSVDEAISAITRYLKPNS